MSPWRTELSLNYHRLSPWEGLTVALNRSPPPGLRELIYHHPLELFFTGVSCPWGLSKDGVPPMLRGWGA